VTGQGYKEDSEAVFMSLLISKFAGASLILVVVVAGCGMVHTHVDCDQVSQHQRSGESDEDVAKATGYDLGQVQSCSEIGSSGGRETANNYQDQPHLPVVPVIPGSIGGAIGR
jgi:hypothetical protein